MKLIVYLLSCIAALVFTNTIEAQDTGEIFESDEDLQKRLLYYRNFSNSITGGKVDFNATYGSGVYCVTKKDIKPKEFVMKIPKEFISCGCNFSFTLVDLYPFEFEIKDALESLFKKRNLNVNETKIKLGQWLFAYQVLFYKYANKEKIFEFIKETGKDYYLINIPKQKQEYFDSLSSEIYTSPMYDDDDINYVGYVGLAHDSYKEAKEVFSHVYNYFSNHEFKVKCLM